MNFNKETFRREGDDMSQVEEMRKTFEHNYIVTGMELRDSYDISVYFRGDVPRDERKKHFKGAYIEFQKEHDWWKIQSPDCKHYTIIPRDAVNYIGASIVAKVKEND